MKTLVAFVVLCCLLFTSSLVAQSPLEKGKEMLRQGKANEAIALFRQVVTTTPKSAEGWTLLGEAYFKASNKDSALLAGKKAISVDDGYVDGYILAARVELSNKNTVGAYNVLRSGLAEKKNNGKLLNQLGYVMLQADSLNRAVIVFTQAREADPTTPAPYEGLGDAYDRQGLTIVAIPQYEKSLDIDSSQTGVYYKLAKAFMKERRYNDAARAYQGVIRLDPTNQAALIELGKLYFLAKQYVNASKFLQKFVEQYPGNKEALAMYTESLFYTRQYAEAATQAQKILQTDPKSVKALRILASSFAELQKSDQAIEAFKKLQQVDSLKVDDWKRMARAYTDIKRDTLALGAFEEIIKIDSNQKDVYAEAGSVAMRLRMWPKAATMFEKRFTMDSSSINPYVNYALCEMQLEKFDDARDALLKVIQKQPTYPQGHLFLARTYIKLDTLPLSINSYREFVKLAEDDEAKFKNELGEATGVIGLGLLLEKKYPQAIEILARSVKFKDDNYQTHLWLAQAYALSNKRDEARKEYQRVLKLDPKNKDALKGMEILGPSQQ
ncbi:MAG: tetratricopeptide repeat protein [Ignavibacteriales bacterium]|nr:tetratricopeptide repeat protein [Ignavibacteriales bacterium]